jgi:hypothetical protein
LSAGAGLAAGAAVLVWLFAVFFTCFTCFLPFLAVSVVCVVELAVVFCAFFAACGAAERKGTATTVNKVDVNNFFMMFSPLTYVAVLGLNLAKSQQLLCFVWLFSLPLFSFLLPPLTTLLCAFFVSTAIASNRDCLSRVLGIATNFS